MTRASAATPARAVTVARYLVLTLMAVAVLLPFAGVALAALHPSGAQISGLDIPSTWSWSNFTQAWRDANFDRLVGSSFVVAAGVVPLALVLATLAAYSLATLNPFGGRTISVAFVLVIVLMQDPDMRTAPTGLGMFVGQFSTNVPLLSAASLIVIGPIVVLYLIFQRNFVSGITQGAVKG